MWWVVKARQTVVVWLGAGFRAGEERGGRVGSEGYGRGRPKGCGSGGSKGCGRGGSKGCGRGMGQQDCLTAQQLIDFPLRIPLCFFGVFSRSFVSKLIILFSIVNSLKWIFLFFYKL